MAAEREKLTTAGPRLTAERCPAQVQAEGWTFHQDDDMPPAHLDVLEGTLAAMGEWGAGSATMSGLDDNDRPLSVYSVVLIEGRAVGFWLDAETGRVLWASKPHG